MFRLQTHHFFVILFFLVITGGYLVMAAWFPVAYVWATYEDLFGEWTQTYLFTAALFLSLWVALSKSPYRVVFAVLAAALFYTVMEEISWGQRIFNFQSPDFFRRNNLQRETNLHNMLVGPFSTGLKDVIEYTLALSLVTYGLVYPLLLRLGWGPARWVSRIGIPAPPLYLWPFFVTGAFLETAPFRFNEAEVAEILIGFALVVTSAHYGFAQRAGLNPRVPPPWAATDSRHFAVLIGVVCVIVAGLATATTIAFYNSPINGPRIDARLLNGYEKFAGRYERYGKWDTAASLYLRVHESEPDRTSILRRLAKAYRKAGDEEMFDKYAHKALAILLAVQAEKPDKVSNNLALARTYRLLGDRQLAGQYGRRAHEIALLRAAREPDSAHRAYWLGKTFRHLDNYAAARDQFKKAFDRNPASKKYRKAYYQMRRIVGE